MDISYTHDVVAQLAPNGVLRAGINLSNFLLVTGKTMAGDPVGVAPDMAKAIADHLGVGLQLVPFPSPGPLADAAVDDVWDIGLIGAEPQRATHIQFSDAYVEIEATYLVWEDARFKTVWFGRTAPFKTRLSWTHLVFELRFPSAPLMTSGWSAISSKRTWSTRRGLMARRPRSLMKNVKRSRV